MIKRILLPIFGTPLSRMAIRHAIELAAAHGARVRILPLLDSDAWKASLEPLMGTADATRLLESRPWEWARRRSARLIDEFEAACRERGVVGEVCPTRGDPIAWLLSQWRYHDLAVLSLRGLLDERLEPSPEAAVRKLIRPGIGPVLAIADDPRPVRSALLLYDGTLECAGVMKLFVQVRPWPDVQLKVATTSTATEDRATLRGEAIDYCAAHGFDVEPIDREPTTVEDTLRCVARSDVDALLVSDSEGAWGGDRLGAALRLVVRRTDLPVFTGH